MATYIMELILNKEYEKLEYEIQKNQSIVSTILDEKLQSRVIHVACANDSRGRIINNILSLEIVDVNERDLTGKTPIGYAITNCNLYAVSALAKDRRFNQSSVTKNDTIAYNPETNHQNSCQIFGSVLMILDMIPWSAHLWDVGWIKEYRTHRGNNPNFSISLRTPSPLMINSVIRLQPFSQILDLCEKCRISNEEERISSSSPNQKRQLKCVYCEKLQSSSISNF